MQNDSKHKSEMSHGQMVAQMEAKFNQRLKEMQENNGQTLNEASQKVKALEREKAHLMERLELTSRD